MNGNNHARELFENYNYVNERYWRIFKDISMCEGSYLKNYFVGFPSKR
jgi:hypothetical protein